MEIIHQLTFKSKDEPRLLSLLNEFGIKMHTINLPNRNDSSVSVQIKESHESWPKVIPYIKNRSIFHSVDTVFSETEILEAEWVRVVNIYARDYPQPEDSWVTHPNNYEENCKSCGSFQQTKPFQIRQEPKLGKNSFMSLNWTGDALFTTPEVIEVWKENNIRGYELWNAWIYKKGIPAKSVLQIFIPFISLPGLLAMEESLVKHCPECNCLKYEYHRRGKMIYKRSSLPTDLDIVRTSEWFGSGHFAYREIFITNRFARIIIENRWKGLDMKVIELV